VVLGT
jgi:adenylosuccinate synthase